MSDKKKGLRDLVHKSGKRLKSKTGITGINYSFTSTINDILEGDKVDIIDYLFVLFIQADYMKAYTNDYPDYTILLLDKDQHKKKLKFLLTDYKGNKNENTIIKLYNFFYSNNERKTIINELMKKRKSQIKHSSNQAKNDFFNNRKTAMHDFFDHNDLVITGFIDNALLPTDFTNENKNDFRRFRSIGLIAINKKLSTKKFNEIFKTKILYIFSTELNDSPGRTHRPPNSKSTVSQIEEQITNYLELNIDKTNYFKDEKKRPKLIKKKRPNPIKKKRPNPIKENPVTSGKTKKYNLANLLKNEIENGKENNNLLPIESNGIEGKVTVINENNNLLPIESNKNVNKKALMNINIPGIKGKVKVINAKKQKKKINKEITKRYTF
jgi:hypothetical protein